MLVAATIRGPLSPLSTAVKVDQVLPGAHVELAVNGAPIGNGIDAVTTLVTVPLGGDQLPPNGLVTAKWSIDGETSPESVPELVLPWPDVPPTPQILSRVHNRADWIRAGGLYPGARVQITGPNGVVAGPITADSDREYLDVSATIAVGDVLHVVQKVAVPGKGTLSSGPGESLPAVPIGDLTGRADRIIPDPTFLEPIAQCARTVHIGGAIEGCWTVLRTDNDSRTYYATHEAFRVTLWSEAHAPATYSVSNKMVRAGLTSGTSTVFVDVAQPLPQPRIVTDPPSCLSTVTVKVVDLTPTSPLKFVVRTDAGAIVIGRSAAPADSTTGCYQLGDLNAYKGGYLSVIQEACAKSLQSNEIELYYGNADQATEPTISPFLPPQRCARWLNVTGVDQQPYLMVHSDVGGWPLLAAWVRPDKYGWVPLNRELRVGESVWVTIDAGCYAPGARRSDAVMVEDRDWGGLQLDPFPRPGLSRDVWFTPDGAVFGVLTHVFVNDKWRNTAYLLPDQNGIASIYVGTLRDGDVVTARQTVCGRDRDLLAHADVRRGSMRLHSSPHAATRGQTMQLLVWGEDADNGRGLPPLPVSGLPPIPNRPPLFLTSPSYGIPWPFTPDASTPAPIHLTVDWEGYDQGVLDIPLADPMVAPPATVGLTIKTESALGWAYGSNQVIVKIKWTVLGGGTSFSSPDVMPNNQKCTATINLPVPQAGSIIYKLGGTAEVVYDYGNTRTTKPVKSFWVYDIYKHDNALKDTIEVTWDGNPLTIAVNLTMYQTPDGDLVPVFRQV